jgi:hypothetical protein
MVYALFSASDAMHFVSLLAMLVTAVFAYNNGVARFPPMGWNTWCTDDACGLIDLCNESLAAFVVVIDT